MKLKLKKFMTFAQYTGNEAYDGNEFNKLLGSLPVGSDYGPISDVKTWSTLVPFNKSIISNQVAFWDYCRKFWVLKDQIQLFHDSEHTEIMNFIITDFDYTREILFGYYEIVMRITDCKTFKSMKESGAITLPDDFDNASYLALLNNPNWSSFFDINEEYNQGYMYYNEHSEILLYGGDAATCYFIPLKSRIFTKINVEPVIEKVVNPRFLDWSKTILSDFNNERLMLIENETPNKQHIIDDSGVSWSTDFSKIYAKYEFQTFSPKYLKVKRNSRIVIEHNSVQSNKPNQLLRFAENVGVVTPKTYVNSHSFCFSLDAIPTDENEKIVLLSITPNYNRNGITTKTKNMVFYRGGFLWVSISQMDDTFKGDPFYGNINIFYEEHKCRDVKPNTIYQINYVPILSNYNSSNAYSSNAYLGSAYSITHNPVSSFVFNIGYQYHEASTNINRYISYKWNDTYMSNQIINPLWSGLDWDVWGENWTIPPITDDKSFVAKFFVPKTDYSPYLNGDGVPYTYMGYISAFMYSEYHKYIVLGDENNNFPVNFHHYHFGKEVTDSITYYTFEKTEMRWFMGAFGLLRDTKISDI